MELEALKDLIKQYKLSPKHQAQIVALSEALAASKDPTHLAHCLVFNLVSHIAHGVELQNPSPEFFSTFIRQLEGSFKLGVMVGADLGTATRECAPMAKGAAVKGLGKAHIAYRPKPALVKKFQRGRSFDEQIK